MGHGIAAKVGLDPRLCTARYRYGVPGALPPWSQHQAHTCRATTGPLRCRAHGASAYGYACLLVAQRLLQRPVFQIQASQPAGPFAAACVGSEACIMCPLARLLPSFPHPFLAPLTALSVIAIAIAIASPRPSPLAHSPWPIAHRRCYLPPDGPDSERRRQPGLNRSRCRHRRQALETPRKQSTPLPPAQQRPLIMSWELSRRRLSRAANSKYLFGRIVRRRWPPLAARGLGPASTRRDADTVRAAAAA